MHKFRVWKFYVELHEKSDFSDSVCDKIMTGILLRKKLVL